ncbi:type III secretion system needle filament subunit SctF [Trinickia caryophylli]|uniref:Type III secretion system major needle protein, YscF/MxiH/PrgI family n=1 Tax=Trinickia caryophylli TaxID=28094 RepID=A0A1X7EXM9_TRICW|nr:type III secretion system needle filament subunit SctF [Trinickia caryophylli]PMS09683.1 EscF/YscF/HrpA family type III secretion system needle major subunit [Trinickia caryophylli]TRX18454.1 type III secretion system needle protein SsaG [Trinickia caryophylli]WQE10761.1 type III secretion system needle filament subunit SctF [Trinickia caryophylli]SMF41665.1 type III secretion system major needle protein, YscF/MxiH/PrgI family [Trinickia caryophylli]GLU33136.1 type III secretion system need
MDVDVVNNELSQIAAQAGQEVQSKMNSADLTDPAKMLQAQFAIQQYSIFIGYQSAVLKAIKDMMQGIIQKI